MKHAENSPFSLKEGRNIVLDPPRVRIDACATLACELSTAPNSRVVQGMNRLESPPGPVMQAGHRQIAALLAALFPLEDLKVEIDEAARLDIVGNSPVGSPRSPCPH